MELKVDGHTLYTLKPDGVNRKNIAQVGVQAWGLTVHNEVIIDHEGLATASEIATRWNIHDSLVSALTEVVEWLDKKYSIDCGVANYHNNNTQNVGITVEYITLPDYPSYAAKAKQLLNQLNQSKP